MAVAARREESEDASGNAAASSKLADDLRHLRKLHGLTLASVAETLGRSVGWLSQVERGLAEPGISQLKTLAALYGIPVSFFFRNDDAPADEAGCVVRAANRIAIGSAEDGLREELLSPDLGGSFELIRSVFAPGARREVMEPRPTEDGGFVVSGTLELTIGAKTFDLSAGDSFQFNRQPYGWANKTDREAVVIWVIAPPVY